MDEDVVVGNVNGGGVDREVVVKVIRGIEELEEMALAMCGGYLRKGRWCC